jgi:hypothetical protein
MNDDPQAPEHIKWNPAIETLIKGLGEKALSMSWLHNRSEKRYSYLNNYLALPTIVLSTITGVGTASWGTEPNINYLMAGISIIVSIISTLNSYFSFAKKAEAHRITAISYSKLYLQISIELSLPRQKRMRVKDFLKNVSEQIQRLNEISPAVPDAVITDYNVKFKDEPQTISKPEIVNGLVDIKIYSDLTDGPSTDAAPTVSIPVVAAPVPAPAPAPPSAIPQPRPWRQ